MQSKKNVENIEQQNKENASFHIYYYYPEINSWYLAFQYILIWDHNEHLRFCVCVCFLSEQLSFYGR